jgi:hypothetical protein
MRRPLFRKVALERLSSPEQLDQLMQVTSPRAWLALIGLGSLIVVGVLWAVFGTIETTEIGQGILIRGSGILTVEAPESGQVTRLNVQPGDVITQGQALASVQPLGQREPITISSPRAGRVLEIRVNEGSVVQSGSALLSVEPMVGEIQAILYLSATSGKIVRPDMIVHVSPSTVRKEEYGVMLGRVISVGEFPATYQGMLRVLGSDELVRALSRGGAPIEVRVELLKAGTDPTTDNQRFQWSSSKGPSVAIQSGTFCTASIIINERRPISLIFGNPQ